jgi:hypothetical protein
MFRFFRLRFEFTALDDLRFPAGKSGNILRGGFGAVFRKIACVPGCPGAAVCERRAECPYARIFEPRAAHGEGPSGLADWPRPFVFRAAHLDGRTVRRGEPFHFGLHVFDIRQPALPYFESALAGLAREGLGPGRGRAELAAVRPLALEGSPLPEPAPVTLPLDPAGTARRIRVRFVTPTELKGADGPDFGPLFARLRDRIGTLSALYGAGPLAIDFAAMGRRAAGVVMTRCDIGRIRLERRSSRTGQVHPLGGFTGEAEYEGALTEFLPWLRAGQWTGVGRHTVWGQGELDVEVLES